MDDRRSVKLFFSGKDQENFAGLQRFTIFAVQFLENEAMSRVCQLTGKKAVIGNKVSHSNRKTKRKFNVNLVTKRFFLPEENRWITLKVSTSALRNIHKKGISACIADARENGFLVK